MVLVKLSVYTIAKCMVYCGYANPDDDYEIIINKYLDGDIIMVKKIHNAYTKYYKAGCPFLEIDNFNIYDNSLQIDLKINVHNAEFCIMCNEARYFSGIKLCITCKNSICRLCCVDHIDNDNKY